MRVPMLAAKLATDDIQGLKYPLYCSPKLDGVRATVQGGVVLSRTLKPIPNKYVQHLFGRSEYEGVDGELIVGDPQSQEAFRTTTSGVMSVEGEPDVDFHVFDIVDLYLVFERRLRELRTRVDLIYIHTGLRVHYVHQRLICNPEELLALLDEYIACGYEGIMLRYPNAAYKHGRSTVREGGLLKFKLFDGSEARIKGCYEMMHNDNEAHLDDTGAKVRSTEASGMVPSGVLGGLTVVDQVSAVVFDLGTGFTAKERADLWAVRDTLVGKYVRYQYQSSGTVLKPRFPVFLGFRDSIDFIDEVNDEQ